MAKRKYTKHPPTTTTERVKLVRRIIKKKCPTVSVRMGKGTAYGYVDITSRDRGARFTDKEMKCLRGLSLNPGSNFDTLNREDQKKFVAYNMMKRAGIKIPR